MNKIKSIICVFVLTMIVFNSCDETNVNAYEQKYQAIQKCINESDFKGAHEVLASITPVYSAYKKSEIEDWEYDKLQRIVYRAEIRYLVDQNDDDSWKRAFFLIQEYKTAKNAFRSPRDEYEFKLELSRSLMEYALIFKHEETASSIRDYTKRLSGDIGSHLGESDDYFDDQYKVLMKQADEIASMY